MRYRCTARFVQAFDRLDAEAQALALSVIRQFHVMPRAPSRDVRVLVANDSKDVWVVPFGAGHALTYSFEYGGDEDNHICVLRVIGRKEELHENHRPDR